MNNTTAVASQSQGPTARTSTARHSPGFSLEPSRYDTLVWLIQAALSVVGLLIFSPLFVLLALAIKLTDGGPVFYRGERVGCRKRIFKIYKFRTLIDGAEQQIGGRLLGDADRDIYCTKVGRILKRTKLDELPQLFNVIRGEMRLVGPRPLRPVFLEQFEREIPNYADRFLVPPGLTGIAQLRGGYYTSPRNKLRYDLVYTHNRSFLLDCQVILLTFVKILDRWLTRGLFILFLFLFVSFVPPDVQPLFSVSFFGMQVSLVYLLILLVSGLLSFKSSALPFSLYRGPLNLPVLCFIILSLFSAFFAVDPLGSLQRAGYFVVTGFLVSFLIVNSLATTGLMTGMVRTIALTSVAISLFGLLQVFLLIYTIPPALSLHTNEKLLENYTRISSILGNPVVLSVYLVLGIPLLLAEVIQSHGQKERDFWLICTTISCVGIVFTQTRVGLLAFLVTGTVFLARRPRLAFSFVSIFLLGLLFVMSLGVPRFSPAHLSKEVNAWVQEETPLLRKISTRQWLIGGEVITTSPFGGVPLPSEGQQSKEEDDEIANMHIVLAVEHGILGWLIIMWLIFSALWSMKQAHDRTKDERLRSTLWAIISSVLGFLVSMNGMNTFHHLTLQIFFWSLIGIGLGLVVRLNGHRRHNLIWRFGDAGD